MLKAHLQQPHIDRFALAMCVLLMAVWVDAVPAHAEPQSAIPSETITLPNQPVEILIDHWGVPHIYAKNEADLFFAQGFNAARDRLFQIDLWRRRGLGQLSEVFGPGFVEQDKATRLFLYRGDMDQECAAYGPDAKQIAEHFVAGVNAYMDWLVHHPDRVPWEFKELNYTPAKWSITFDLATSLWRLRVKPWLRIRTTSSVQPHGGRECHREEDQVRTSAHSAVKTNSES